MHKSIEGCGAVILECWIGRKIAAPGERLCDIGLLSRSLFLLNFGFGGFFAQFLFGESMSTVEPGYDIHEVVSYKGHHS